MTNIVLLKENGKMEYINSIKDIKTSKRRKYKMALVPIDELNCYLPMNIDTLLSLENTKIKINYQLIALQIVGFDNEIEEYPLDNYTMEGEGLEWFLKIYTFIASMIVIYNMIIGEFDSYVSLLDFLYFDLEIESKYGNKEISIKRKGDGSFASHLDKTGYCLSDECYQKFTKYFNVRYIENNCKLSNTPIIITDDGWKYLYAHNIDYIYENGLIAMPLDSVPLYHCIDMKYIKYFKYVKKCNMRYSINTFVKDVTLSSSMPSDQLSLNLLYEKIDEEGEVYNTTSSSIQRINDLIEFIVFFKTNLYYMKYIYEEIIEVDMDTIMNMDLYIKNKSYELYGSINSPIEISEIFQTLSYIYER